MQALVSSKVIGINSSVVTATNSATENQSNAKNLLREQAKFIQEMSTQLAKATSTCQLAVLSRLIGFDPQTALRIAIRAGINSKIFVQACFTDEVRRKHGLKQDIKATLKSLAKDVSSKSRFNKTIEKAEQASKAGGSLNVTAKNMIRKVDTYYAPLLAKKELAAVTPDKTQSSILSSVQHTFTGLASAIAGEMQGSILANKLFSKLTRAGLIEKALEKQFKETVAEQASLANKSLNYASYRKIVLGSGINCLEWQSERIAVLEHIAGCKLPELLQYRVSKNQAEDVAKILGLELEAQQLKELQKQSLGVIIPFGRTSLSNLKASLIQAIKKQLSERADDVTLVQDPDTGKFSIVGERIKTSSNLSLQDFTRITPLGDYQLKPGEKVIDASIYIAGNRFGGRFRDKAVVVGATIKISSKANKQASPAGNYATVLQIVDMTDPGAKPKTILVNGKIDTRQSIHQTDQLFVVHQYVDKERVVPIFMKYDGSDFFAGTDVNKQLVKHAKADQLLISPVACDGESFVVPIIGKGVLYIKNDLGFSLLKEIGELTTEDATCLYLAGNQVVRHNERNNCGLLDIGQIDFNNSCLVSSESVHSGSSHVVEGYKHFFVVDSVGKHPKVDVICFDNNSVTQFTLFDHGIKASDPIRVTGTLAENIFYLDYGYGTKYAVVASLGEISSFHTHLIEKGRDCSIGIFGNNKKPWDATNLVVTLYPHPESKLEKPQVIKTYKESCFPNLTFERLPYCCNVFHISAEHKVDDIFRYQPPVTATTQSENSIIDLNHLEVMHGIDVTQEFENSNFNSLLEFETLIELGNDLFKLHLSKNRTISIHDLESDAKLIEL